MVEMKGMEIINAEIQLQNQKTDIIAAEQYTAQIEALDQQLKSMEISADRWDYILSISSGIICGIIDNLFVEDFVVSEKDIALSHEKVNRFIETFAKKAGWNEEGRLKGAISFLEKKYEVAQDNVWKGANIKVGAKTHHLADFAHHPTLFGLISSIAVEFLNVGIFVNRDGEWNLLAAEENLNEAVKRWVPLIISGVANWLVYVLERKYQEEIEDDLPKGIVNLFHLLVSIPAMIPILKCIGNWAGHLVSDVGGSKQTAGGGMGLPGVFLSLGYEIASLPILKDTGLPHYLNELYEKQKLDLRHELPYAEKLGKQAIPVLLNETIVRLFYFIRNFASQLKEIGSLKKLNWEKILPFSNRTITRMLTISEVSFSLVDMGGAAISAAVDEAGCWPLIAVRFTARINYVGLGRLAISVVQEVSEGAKEKQLLRERTLLIEARQEQRIVELQNYRESLQNLLAQYLADEYETFLLGFSDIEEGIKKNDIGLFINGNVTIQRKLGHEIQFATQEEFDDLMLSDDAFKL